ncbi:MAG: hypothetical protein AAGI08_12435 [Bacteroidota bacterium]
MRTRHEMGDVRLHESNDNIMTTHRILVLTGASGAGKTTILNALKAQNLAGVAYMHFDDIGVPSTEDMHRLYGGPEAWQRHALNTWARRISEPRDGVRAVFLDVQVRPSEVREAFRQRGVDNIDIVLVDCDYGERNRRLIEDRGQPELATAQMDQWAAYLRGQADALGLAIIDTAELSIEEAAKRLTGLV